MRVHTRLLLATAISSISATSSYADFQMLDDSSMEVVTGQAGITIDVETQWEIGEFAYHDAGYLLIQGIRMGGNSMSNGTGSNGELLDNLRMVIDISGDGSTFGDNEFAYGFSDMREIAHMYVDAGNSDVNFANLVNGIDSSRDNALVDDKKAYNDGDLIIHSDFTDGWHNEGGFAAYSAADRFLNDDYSTAEKVLEQAVDFRIEIDAIGIAASTYEVGSAGLEIDTRSNGSANNETTTLISQLSMQGYLGPADLLLENNGNGFDGSGPLGVGSGKADSKIYWSSYTKITDLDVYIDIAGVQISDMRIHNERGDLTGLDGTSAFGFSHSILEVYAVRNGVLNINALGNTLNDKYVDGIAINMRFKGDIDIGSISFGDTGTSIGSLYVTDLESTTNWLISAH